MDVTDVKRAIALARARLDSAEAALDAGDGMHCSSSLRLAKELLEAAIAVQHDFSNVPRLGRLADATLHRLVDP